jgi:predicted phage replisome organizer
MSDNKKYYWLKLKDNFFDTEEMKILESQINGASYQNLYLKLCLLSLKNNGCLKFKDHIPYDLPMLSTILRVDIDTIKVGVELFGKLGLMDILDSGNMFMSEIQSLIGLSSTEGDRKKIFREKIKKQKLIEEGGHPSAKRPPEIEIEIEIEKDIKNIVHPTLEQIKEYVQEKNYNIDCNKFYEYYSSTDWRDKNNKPVKSWKHKLILWKNNSITNKSFKDYE